MQPTVPAWVTWYRRLRPARADLARVHDLALPRARAPSRVAVYTNVFKSIGNQNLPLMRLENFLGNDHHLIPTPPSAWLKRLNINTDMWPGHISTDLSKDAIDYNQRFHNYSPVSIMLPPNAAIIPGGGMGGAGGSIPLSGGGGARGHSHGGHGGHGAHASGGAVWGGWAAGAVLLALLVLIVRAAEKCLDRRLFKTTRRQSEEWPTPNVMATSLQHQNLDGTLPHLDDSEFSSPNHRNSDLPPPYSECAPNNNINVNKNIYKPNTEEPPPPYSACLVAFSNKDIPTVHIHRRHAIEEPQTSSEVDNVHNNLIETQHRVDTEQSNFEEGVMRVELVFDNGRIVERTINVNSIDNVPEIVANLGETVIGSGSPDDNVTYVDDNVTETNSNQRVVFV